MITILHTNDLHGCFGILPRLASLIKKERERNSHTLLLDTGDISLVGRSADLGVQLYRLLKYDAITPGNGEKDVLEERSNLAKVDSPILSANIDSDRMGLYCRSHIIRKIDGIRVAVTGLTVTTPYPKGHRLHRPDAQQEIAVRDPVKTANSLIPRLRREADLVIVMSHLGLWNDVTLAQTVPGIDLIIGGHSHHRLPSLLRISRTYLAQAGAIGSHLGVITVEGNHGDLRFRGRLEPVWQSVEENGEMVDHIRSFLLSTWAESTRIIGSTAGCWADPWLENPWANFVTDLIRAHTGTDICFDKAMALFPALDPGKITEWDVWRCLPGEEWMQNVGLDRIVTMQLEGRDILSICEHSVSSLPWDFHKRIPTHFNLPGNNLLQVSGLQIVYDLTHPQGKRVVRCIAGRENLKMEKTYSVAVSRFLAEGYSGYRWFCRGTSRREGEKKWDIILSFLNENSTLPAKDGRLQFK